MTCVRRDSVELLQKIYLDVENNDIYCGDDEHRLPEIVFETGSSVKVERVHNDVSYNEDRKIIVRQYQVIFKGRSMLVLMVGEYDTSGSNVKEMYLEIYEMTELVGVSTLGKIPIWDLKQIRAGCD